MLTQGDFWILVLIGLLIANLALLFYVKSDFDKKVDKLSQEVENIRENLHYLKQDSDRKMTQFLKEVDNIKANYVVFYKEVSDIKGRLILDLDKKVSKLSQEVEGIQVKVKDIKENLIHMQQNFDKKLAELLQEVNDIKVRLILDLDKKTDKLSQEVESIKEGIEQLEQQTRKRIDHIAKLLTEPISDESELKI